MWEAFASALFGPCLTTPRYCIRHQEARVASCAQHCMEGLGLNHHHPFGAFVSPASNILNGMAWARGITIAIRLGSFLGEMYCLYQCKAVNDVLK
jgi:hypothetical protein